MNSCNLNCDPINSMMSQMGCLPKINVESKEKGTFKLPAS